MWRLILVSLAFLGWAFWELSGGAEYAPRAGSLQAAARGYTAGPDQGAPGARQQAEAVTRQNTRNTDIALATARPAPQPTEARPEQVFSPRTSLFSQPVLAEPNAAPPAPRPVSETQRDLRQVAGNRVNMRTGPGTSYGVLATMDRGARVEVLDAPGNGWVKLRVEASGRVGWMAASLLGAAN